MLLLFVEGQSRALGESTLKVRRKSVFMPSLFAKLAVGHQIRALENGTLKVRNIRRTYVFLLFLLFFAIIITIIMIDNDIENEERRSQKCIHARNVCQACSGLSNSCHRERYVKVRNIRRIYVLLLYY